MQTQWFLEAEEAGGWMGTLANSHAPHPINMGKILLAKRRLQIPLNCVRKQQTTKKVVRLLVVVGGTSSLQLAKKSLPNACHE